MTSFDPFAVLGIPRDADAVTIRRAYQKLARRFHPDLYPGDPQAEHRFEDVARAYRILSSPELRGRYEAGMLEAERRLQEPARREAARARAVPGRFRYESFLEVHAEWSGEGPEEPRREDLVAELSLEFAEAVRGATTSFSVQRERGCLDCGGQGEGVTGSPCERCAGRGVVVDLDRIRVRIPEGVDDGTRLRLPGKGSPPTAIERGGPLANVEGSEAGDLFLTVRVRPHPYFRRRGLDVLADLPVTYAEAALGAEVDVPTIDGPVRVRLPPGTTGGQRFRLRGRGVTLPGGRSGDHYYTVQIAVPERVDEETRALIERLPRQEPRSTLPREPL
jgi:DnaJ-class molecular chaperone